MKLVIVSCLPAGLSAVAPSVGGSPERSRMDEGGILGYFPLRSSAPCGAYEKNRTKGRTSSLGRETNSQSKGKGHI